ncbi:MAG: hypothetical protein E7191_08805 [Erysipelotrichaceae bacterium]|nr:hypothetical protein [Erysipelotrichaceae bacterium]
MKKNNSILSRFIRLVLSIVFAVSLGLGVLPTEVRATSTVDKVADPSTIDGWTKYFDLTNLSTENAGGVWTDKSVFETTSELNTALGSNLVSGNTTDNSFLVTLSAIGSSESIAGVTNVPVDVMIILDMSSSMYNGTSKETGTVQSMVDAVNNMIKELEKNEANRVGVVIYYGGDYIYPQSSANSSKVLLPLDRYTHASDKYLEITKNNTKLSGIQVASNVKNSNNTTMPSNTYTVPNVAGTYAQQGILKAMEQFLAVEDTMHNGTTPRVPVFVFMSDGEPTAATENFANAHNEDATMGNNQVRNRQADQTDFVTQLTAAYAKAQVDAHYSDAINALFYTLSLGSSVSLEVMDPANHTTDSIDHYWRELVSNERAYFQTLYFKTTDTAGVPTGVANHTVVKKNGFPNDVGQRVYVDEAFTAATADQLGKAFTDILFDISHKNEYYPTLVEGNANISGNVSFVDKIGKYMHVEGIKGIIINGVLYDGSTLSENFVSGGGKLGTYDDPTPLGDNLIWSVKERLGITDSATARTLVGLAYEHGQLSYTDDDNYSNYIGWYADEDGIYEGFYHEGSTTVPADAKYKVKSYGYLGEHESSDLMYATVQVRTNIETGEEIVTFAVPAALLPTIKYTVELDESENVKDLLVDGATSPIRLVYEVSLDDDINGTTLFEKVDPTYLSNNKNTDGTYSFYTNEWERDRAVGHGKTNTYSYFYPARENSRYYYQENALIYKKTGTDTYEFYEGSVRPDGEYYRKIEVYKKNGSTVTSDYVYQQIGEKMLVESIQNSDNTWYIQKDSVFEYLIDFKQDKDSNDTGTFITFNDPFVDYYGHTLHDANHIYVIGATLGNNGSISIAPRTGIAISKDVVTAIPTNDTFTFAIDGPTTIANSTYPTVLEKKDGTQVASNVTFDADGDTKIELRDGEELFILDLPVDVVLKVTEQTLTGYKLSKVDGVATTDPSKELTTIQDRVVAVHYENNSLTGTVELKISGTKVLDGMALVNDMFEFVLEELDHENNVINQYTAYNTVTGGFEFDLFFTSEGTHSYRLREVQRSVVEEHNFRFDTTVYDIIVEVNTTTSGLEANYVVSKDGSPVTNIKFRNEYLRGPVLVLTGNKTLTGRSLQANEFEFVLYEANDTWDTTTVVERVKNAANGTFEFSELRFDNEGHKRYVIKEETADPLDRVTYDINEYRVFVEILEHEGNPYIEGVWINDQDGNPVREIVFNNVYDIPDDPDSPSRTSARFIAEKELEGRNLKASEFTFVLKDEDGDVLQTKRNTAKGTISFAPISYSKSDIGTHYYTISEVEGNDEDITYDTTVYDITVEVSMNGSRLVAKTYVDGVEDKDMIFTNTYGEEELEDPVDPPVDPVDPTDPPEPTDPGHDVPNTADATDYALWFMMMLFAMIASVVFYKLKEE